jgi:hypothetical protein
MIARNQNTENGTLLTDKKIQALEPIRKTISRVCVLFTNHYFHIILSKQNSVEVFCFSNVL